MSKTSSGARRTTARPMTFTGEDITDAFARVTADPSPHRHFDSMKAYDIDRDTLGVFLHHMRQIIQAIDESDMDEEDGKVAFVATTALMVGVDMERDRWRKA